MFLKIITNNFFKAKLIYYMNSNSTFRNINKVKIFFFLSKLFKESNKIINKQL